MNSKILLPQVQAYLIKNEHTHLADFILAGSPFPDIEIQELAQQLEGKQRSKEKLPTWHTNKNIYFPPKRNLEQTSGESAAAYKADLIKGKNLADLTGGLGIDSFYLTKKAKQIDYFEIKKPLAAIAAHNFKALGAQNIIVHDTDGIAFLEQNKTTYDTIFIDPSRRHSAKGKVFFLSDCEPDVLENMDVLLAKSANLMIKTSPLLDIQAGLKQLKSVKEIHIVAVKNEVKELLWVLKKGCSEKDIKLFTINIDRKSENRTLCSYYEALEAQPEYAMPLRYLYEPHAALMKSGLFNWISAHFNLKKLHNNTHLYTADKRITFPGRCFEILKKIPYSKKNIATNYKGSAANITKRNFKESVEQLRKKYKIREGGERYLFFTTTANDEKWVMECRKLQ